MAPLPPNSILRAALRWQKQLAHSTVERAQAIFSAVPDYRDLTLTQYSAAFEWLQSIGFVDERGKVVKRGELAVHTSLAEDILQAAIEEAQPSWIRDADMIIGSIDDLPDDLILAAEALELKPSASFSVVHRAWGKIDTELRNEIGAAGERALVQMLRSCSHAQIVHVGDRADGFGYDIVVQDGVDRINLEVKSTIRRGRLSFFLSRNEYNVMCADPSWRLVALLLDESRQATAIGVCDSTWIHDRAPADTTREGVWQSARFNVSATAMKPGLVHAMPWAFRGVPAGHPISSGYIPSSQPDWLR